VLWRDVPARADLHLDLPLQAQPPRRVRTDPQLASELAGPRRPKLGAEGATSSAGAPVGGGPCAAAGAPGRLLHDFRRTAVRNLVRGRVRDTVATKVADQKTRRVFGRYNITSEKDARAALGRLSGQEEGKSALRGRVVDLVTH
jgi:hypothetical protein